MNTVKVSERNIIIPTYEAGKPCEHPIFPEKRAYHGSSGKVYPYPVTEAMSDEKTDKEYIAVYLENEYLRVVILPEIGGKIYRIYDKTNGYDAVYYNDVIKPSFVGLAGPWTVGGIEISWPQHHRPSHFDAVDYEIAENEDGSVTVWCGETENMNHTKGMAGYTLYPGKAYLEIKGQLYNPTEIPQTFLWWTNPAVPANENTKIIFPSDIHAVMDYEKKSISKFPIATGTYYNVDYSEGVDISRYKNIPVPTSYMAIKSKYDFIGNYDFEKKAGFLHVADHHIAPGKKQWTAGSGDYGRAWDRSLTDSGEPYTELMAGVFSDNQTDFSFLMPYEEKSFKQYFIPYKKIGEVKNATKDIMVNLEVACGEARISIYASSEMKISVILNGTAVASYMRETVTVSPYEVYSTAVELDEGEEETGISLVIRNRQGEIIMQYTPEVKRHEKLPEPVQAIRRPKEISSAEELFLTAMHLEQSRHPTKRPEEYYLEGLRRDPDDMRLNNGYGKLLYRKGLFEEAEKHLRAAVRRATKLNNNPYDCEPYYNLGLALKMQQRYDEAYDAFYRSIWDGKMQDKGYYQLACVSAKQNEFEKALEFVEQALIRGTHNMKARTLRSALLRHAGRLEEAEEFIKESIKIDPLDFGARYELFATTRNFDRLDELKGLMRNSIQNYADLSIGYAEANLFTDAANVLALVADVNEPMLHYYMAYYSNSDIELEVAKNSGGEYVFPNRIQSIFVLNHAIKHSPNDWFAHYSLGNLYYDKGVWFKAIKCWKDALECDRRNSRVMRNLAIATYNKLGDHEEALRLMERAAMYAPEDARIYYELDLLRKKMNQPVMKRLKDMVDNIEVVETRDDLYIEYITLLNNEMYYEYALREIKRHTFRIHESLGGKIVDQYRRANMGLARELIADGDYEGAKDYLEAALQYPENLGEGKYATSMDSDIYYLLGRAYEQVDKITAIEYYNKAVEGKFTLNLNYGFRDVPPEMFFFRTLAYGMLGNEKKMKGGFNTLIDYCEAHIGDKPNIDDFDIALPDFLVFDGNLETDNYVHCCYMAALGWYGKGDKAKSDEYIEMGLEKNCSHQGLLFLKNSDRRAKTIKQEDPTLMRIAKWNTST